MGGGGGGGRGTHELRIILLFFLCVCVYIYIYIAGIPNWRSAEGSRGLSFGFLLGRSSRISLTPPQPNLRFRSCYMRSRRALGATAFSE